MRALALAALALAACASSLRQPVTPAEAARAPRHPERILNRELLTPTTARIVFLVELVDGHRPATAALDHLVAIAARYGERPAYWYPADLARVRPSQLRADTTYVVVRYVGEQLKGFGLTSEQWLLGRSLVVIEINQEAHHRWALLLPEARLEAQTLVHEYGHALGLPSPDHGYYPRFPSTEGGRHCVNPDCPLTLPSLRSLLYGAWHTFVLRHFLDDYCAACRRDIAAAKAAWRRAATAS